MIRGSVVKQTSIGSVAAGTVDEPGLAYTSPSSTSSTEVVATLEDDRRLSYNPLSLNEAGLWTIVWSANVDDDGNIYRFVEQSILPVTWIDIKAMVLAELQLESSSIDNQLFDMLLAGSLRYWLKQFEDVIVYDELGVINGQVFDTALSLIMGCVMRSYTGSSMEQVGEVAAVATGPDKVQFHRRYAAITLDDASRSCLDRAWTLFNTINGIFQWNLEQAANYDVVKTAGRRQAIRRTLGYTSMVNPLYSLWNDEVVRIMWAGGYLDGLAP